MAKLLYRDYYKRFGLRRYQELMNPRLFVAKQLTLPKYAIYNFVQGAMGQIGPDTNDYMFRGESTALWVQFAAELASMQGNPRRNQTFVLSRKELDWRSENPRFRLLRSVGKLNNNINAQAVENFVHLDQMYIYRDTPTRWLDKWHNKINTVWQTMNTVGAESDRQQLMVIRLPEQMPKISLMRTASKTPSRTNLLNFPDDQSLTFFDFFRWLGPQRDQSTMKVLNRDALERINVVFTDGYSFFIANLGLLEGWREQLNKGQEPTRPQLEELQRRWMAGCVKIAMIKHEDDEEVLAERRAALDDEELRDLMIERPGLETQDPGDYSVDDYDWGPEPEAVGGDEDEEPFDRSANDIRQIDEVESAPVREQAEDDSLSDDDFDFKLEEPVENNVSEIDPLAEQPNLSHAEYVEDLTLSVVEVADQLADAGVLSSVQYKAALRNANAINEISAPFGDDSVTLAEYIEVTPEQQVVTPKPVIKVTDTMEDPSMAVSTMAGWDEHYVNEVMHKDIAAAVVAMQQAGYPVTNYKVEEVTDVMGDYFVVTIQLSPVGGTPSTFKLQFPKVDENGVYTVNGQKYRMRKQRVDLPIRKISPTEVALNTAYGKLFVRRSEKVVNDVGKWLSRQLRIAYRTVDSGITALKSGNVFYEEDQTAYYYSSLAQYFVQLRYNQWDVYFNTRALKDIFGEETLTAYGAVGRLPIGRNETGVIMSISADDQIFIGEASPDIHPVGTLPDFLGIDLTKLPRENATLDFMGVSVPLGMVLGYYVGLTDLLAHLKTRYRLVPRGTRLDLGLDEVALPFDDDSIVYSRNDKLAALLLGGYWAYRKELTYARGMFDEPDVYLNVLESTGIKVRHLAELDRMEKLFIDPVSRKLLQNMREPTEFKRLLLRAGELLLTNWSPRANDARYQRYKTYDKFAELTYKELVRGIRANENNPSGKRTSISLSPMAVWNELLDDSAAITVDETNPFLDVKQGEEATLSGTNGRSKMTMRKADTRAYDESDVGTVSEGTKDSGDVGVSAYLAPNANIVSVYGETREYNPETDGVSTLNSTSVMAVPGVDRDDQESNRE